MSQRGEIVSVETPEGTLHFCVIQGNGNVSIQEYHPETAEVGAECDDGTVLLGDNVDPTQSACIGSTISTTGLSELGLIESTVDSFVSDNSKPAETGENDAGEVCDQDTSASEEDINNYSISLTDYSVKHETFPLKRQKGIQRDVTVTLSFCENALEHRYTLTGKGVLFENSEPDLNKIVSQVGRGNKCLIKMDGVVVAMDNNDEDLHKCGSCDRVFKHSHHLESHAKTHAVEKAFGCDVCSVKFSHMGNLTRHRKAKHPEAKGFGCSQCVEEFSCTEKLDEHKRIHSGEKSFDCGTCSKKFLTRRHMLLHQRIHKEEKSFICPLCERAFVLAEYLKNHMRVHSNVPEFRCMQCNLEFRYKSTYKQHVEKVHVGMLPHKCDVCNKGFSRNYNLKLHKRVHTGEKPYECLQCPKAFACSTDLVRHGRLHTEERPYKCDICGKGFTQNTSLKTHKKGHAAAARGSANRQNAAKQLSNENSQMLSEAISSLFAQ